MAIHNPILRGFCPDPSIVRVGDDYYIATSTFEWFPGVRLHHSRDLVQWRPIGYALGPSAGLDLRGVPDSGGVWAPSLSYADGRFWLVYAVVRTFGLGQPFKDLGIFLTTAPEILGPWAVPRRVAGTGFDPSLFHAADGRKWLVNLSWDFRQSGVRRFSGIVAQELDPDGSRSVGPLKRLLACSRMLLEGPKLCRKGEWHFLMVAEGGTGWDHGISTHRSRELTGPYESDPEGPLLTTRDDPGSPLQKAGHGELVETPGGEWYLAHLASRPLLEGGKRCCPLGRETCLQKIRWTDEGWPRLEQGGRRPQVVVPAPKGETAEGPFAPLVQHDDFDGPVLGPAWQSLRVPVDETWASLSARPGWLRLRGRESLHSPFEQSLLARPLREFQTVAQTCLEFEPSDFTQMAGLACYYDTRMHYCLRVTRDESRGKVLGVVLTDDGTYRELNDALVEVNDWPHCHLRASFEGAELRFSASPDSEHWQDVGPALDAAKLSDDYGAGLHFTGAMVGLWAQDLGGGGATADFGYFSVSESADEAC